MKGFVGLCDCDRLCEKCYHLIGHSHAVLKNTLNFKRQILLLLSCFRFYTCKIMESIMCHATMRRIIKVLQRQPQALKGIPVAWKLSGSQNMLAFGLR